MDECDLIEKLLDVQAVLGIKQKELAKRLMIGEASMSRIVNKHLIPTRMVKRRIERFITENEALIA